MRPQGKTKLQDQQRSEVEEVRVGFGGESLGSEDVSGEGGHRQCPSACVLVFAISYPHTYYLPFASA